MPNVASEACDRVPAVPVITFVASHPAMAGVVVCTVDDLQSTGWGVMANDLNDVPTGWIVTGILAIIATLAGAVKMLFSMRESENKTNIEKLEARILLAENRIVESDKKHDECQNDRMRLGVKVAELEGKLSALECKTCNMPEKP